MASPQSLPSAPSVEISASAILQPPLTYRSTGPPLLLLLPPLSSYPPLPTNHRPPIDPAPLQKWAEEGFTVLECRPREEGAAWKTVEDCLRKGGEVLLQREEVSVLMMEPSGLGIVCYDEELREELMGLLEGEGASGLSVLGLVSFGEVRSFGGDELAIPWFEHVRPPKEKAASRSPDSMGKTFIYPSATSSRFVLPGDVEEYRAQEAGLCHGRSLGLLRKALGGPEFDLEALWEEHCLYEFGERSVEKTMMTMVAEPYVNHVPTLTGGIGRVALTSFYQNHFIFANPADTKLVTLSRTVGVNTVVDEFIMEFTHDRMIDWLAPGVPPTNIKVHLPMMSVVTLRGDRLASERIWWDQATLLSQLGLLPSHVPWSSSSSLSNEEEFIRLPVSGLEQAGKLVDEGEGESNEMMGEGWGVSSRK